MHINDNAASAIILTPELRTQLRDVLIDAIRKGAPGDHPAYYLCELEALADGEDLTDTPVIDVCEYFGLPSDTFGVI